MNIKRILPFIPVFAVTIFSLIIMVKVLTAQIGNLETWRVAASVTGFFTFFLL
jgi:hypothetical protein